MHKKILLSFLIIFIHSTSYAYVITTDFTVENKTDINMQLEMNQPNGQGKSVVYVPAHTLIKLYLENGDHSGMLFRTATAPFKLTDVENKKLYLQGRIGYYVGGLGIFSLYSFLDGISAASGLT